MSWDGLRRVLEKNETKGGTLTYQIREDYKAKRFVETVWENGRLVDKFKDEYYSEYFQGVTFRKTEEGYIFLPWCGFAPCAAFSMKTSEVNLKFVLGLLNLNEFE